MQRLRELDFLRGMAIVLVLLRHIPLFSYTTNMGWIGVDLFFVLSGFLVSGLLFKEYMNFGNIRPKLFLIRRGFKIYPIYYLSYLLYLYPIVVGNRFDLLGFLADMTFTQNYVWGWGYAYAATWSLAVEEHFYFGFTLFLWLGIKYHEHIRRNLGNLGLKNNAFEWIVVCILVLCLAMRFISNTLYPLQFARHITMTHLRIDSLLCGVLIAYLYYFKLDKLKQVFESQRLLLYTIAFLGVCWTPFVDSEPSFFAKTLGFTILYISFGILLLSFLLEKNINGALNRIFSRPVVNFISKIGVCSYSIYVIHLFVQAFIIKILLRFNYVPNKFLFFFVTCAVCIWLGTIMTHRIENYFLKVRNKYFPSRT